MIYFDLDGVIRDLSSMVYDKEPTNYFNKTRGGKSFPELIDENLGLLITAPPTDYFFHRNYEPKYILSHQPWRWRTNTDLWIKKFCGAAVVVQYVEKPEDKLGFLKNGDFLVEDYPFFVDYSRIILVRKPYNANVVNPLFEVWTWRELNETMRLLKTPKGGGAS